MSAGVTVALNRQLLLLLLPRLITGVIPGRLAPSLLLLDNLLDMLTILLILNNLLLLLLLRLLLVLRLLAEGFACCPGTDLPVFRKVCE